MHLLVLAKRHELQSLVVRGCLHGPQLMMGSSAANER